MNAFNPVFLLAGVMALLVAQADGQGTLLLNNYDSAKGVWLIQNGATNPAPAGTMVQVLGGPDTNHLAPVTNTVGVSLYTIAAGDTNALGAGTGSFFDYGFGNVTGTTTNGTGMLQVLAWYGAATYAQATTRGATVAWSQTLGGRPPLPGLPTPRVLAMPAKLYMTSSGGGAPTGSTNGPGGGQGPLSGASYGCELWLEAERGTNALLLILHNTLPLQTYSVWSIGDLTQTNWALETNVTGACESATATP